MCHYNQIDDSIGSGSTTLADMGTFFTVSTGASFAALFLALAVWLFGIERPVRAVAVAARRAALLFARAAPPLRLPARAR